MYQLSQKQIEGNYVASFLSSLAGYYSLDFERLRVIIAKTDLISNLVNNFGYYHMYDTKTIIENDFKKYVEGV